MSDGKRNLSKLIGRPAVLSLSAPVASSLPGSAGAPRRPTTNLVGFPRWSSSPAAPTTTPGAKRRLDDPIVPPSGNPVARPARTGGERGLVPAQTARRHDTPPVRKYQRGSAQEALRIARDPALVKKATDALLGGGLFGYLYK